MGSQLILMWIFLFDAQRKANTIRLPISLNFVDNKNLISTIITIRNVVF